MASPRPHRAMLAASLAAILVIGCSNAVSPSPQGSAGIALASASIVPSGGVPAPSPSVKASAAPSVEPSVEPSATTTPDPSAEPASESPVVEPVANPSERPLPPSDPSCGTGQTAFEAHRDEIPHATQFGAATLQFTTAGIEMRDGSYTTDDVIPAGIGLSPKQIAVVVAPGDHIILRTTGLTLRFTEASVVPWSSVSFVNGLASSSATPVGLSWRFRADGSLSISAPDQVGDYEVFFGPRWYGVCLDGDGTAYGRIKVR